MAREICPMCNGSGQVVDEDNQTTVNCDACNGEGFIET
jgi:DnaJ-class molecular chaperone